MRNITYLIILIVFTTACNDDFLEQQRKGLLVPDTYISTVEELDKAVSGIYFLSGWEHNNLRANIWMMPGDDITTHTGKGIFQGVEQFRANNTDPWVNYRWIRAYKTIKQANWIIDNVENVKQIGVNVKKRALGQSYFFRAMSYFDLTRAYNNVPLITSGKININSTEAPKMAAEVYDTIVSDLQKAESLLPLQYSALTDLTATESSTAYARVTSGAVKALLAEVYLTMAGYPLNDPDNNSSGYYSKAAEKAKEIIGDDTTTNAYGYNLVPNFNDLWVGETTTFKNEEMVFGLFYNKDFTEGGDNEHANWWAPYEFRPAHSKSGWSDAFAELKFFNDFPKGPRKDATFFTTIIDKGVVKPWDKWPTRHPHFRKWMWMNGMDTNLENTDIAIPTSWKSSRTLFVIRYAQVLLIYAEAAAMSGGNMNLAYKCLDKVRKRAGLPGLTVGVSGNAFRDSVILERKWEFAGMECAGRWPDMLRTKTWKLAEDRIMTGRAKEGYPVIIPANEKDLFMPYPANDKNLNPNLK